MAATTTINVHRGRPQARVWHGSIIVREVDADVTLTFTPGDEEAAKDALDAAYAAAAAELEAITR